MFPGKSPRSGDDFSGSIGGPSIKERPFGLCRVPSSHTFQCGSQYLEAMSNRQSNSTASYAYRCPKSCISQSDIHNYPVHSALINLIPAHNEQKCIF